LGTNRRLPPSPMARRRFCAALPSARIAPHQQVGQKAGDVDALVASSSAEPRVLAERRISGELKLHARSSDLRHMLSQLHTEWTSMESFEAGKPTPLNQEEEVRCSESLGRLLYTDLRSTTLATGWPIAMIRQQSIRNCADQTLAKPEPAESGMPAR